MLLLGFNLEVMTRMPVQLQPYQPILILELLGDLLLGQDQQMKLLLLGSRAICCGFSARYRHIYGPTEEVEAKAKTETEVEEAKDSYNYITFTISIIILYNISFRGRRTL